MTLQFSYEVQYIKIEENNIKIFKFAMLINVGIEFHIYSTSEDFKHPVTMM